jgi:hypothetical protein
VTDLQDNRKPTNGQVFIVGTVLGAGCYLLAEALVPREVRSPGEHDLHLAYRLGFIYPPVVAIWIGWLQRSWLRALFGAMLGVLIGVLYLLLCGRNFWRSWSPFRVCLAGSTPCSQALTETRGLRIWVRG